MAYEPELERLERRYQDDPARNFAQLAEAYRKAGRLDDALTLLQGHLTERPNYVSGLVVLGRCLLDQQNDAEARATFERVLGVDGEHIIALRALGEIAERGGELAGARQWFTRLLDVDPMNEDAEQALQRITEAGLAPEAPAAPAEAPVSIASLLLDEPEPASPAAVVEEPAAEPPVVAESPSPALPETYAVPQVEEVSWSGRTAEFSGEEPEAEAEPEFVLEESEERFMPRPSGAHPRDVEPIGDLEITSQLEEEESPIGAVPDVEESFQFPTGEREVDLGLPDVQAAADQLADEGPGRAPGSQEAGITPFDDTLGWGAGERISRQISREDLAEIAKAHEATAAPVSELPGLESTEIPTADAGIGVGPVEGLQALEPGEVEPLEGFEATAGGGIPDEEPIQFVEQEPVVVVNEEIIPVVPDVLEESDEAVMDASGEIVDRATAERRASLMGLPLLDGSEAEPEAPLVLEAEPEPVVTETMAELYVKQGLLDEARHVYERLLARRPGDARLRARLADLEAAAKPLRASVQFAAARSGGQSARGMMVAVLAARPGEKPSAARPGRNSVAMAGSAM